MLTTQAFNALLKTLEEPPSHVIFVLCTTDPQKILETILSRCQRFDFHRISNDDIIGRLRYICEQEGFAFDEEALEVVARHARGGMRDALSTLEQLSVFGDGSVRIDDARALLGEVASTVLSEFACKMAVRDTVGLFGLIRAQVDEGNDLQELTRDLIAHIRDVYTAAIAGPCAELFDGTPEEVAALVEEARLFEGADRLSRALTVLDDAALEMRNATDPRLVLEIACTRLARPESDLTLEALAERIARLEAQIASGVPSAPMSAEQLASATRSKAAPAPVSARAVPPTSAPTSAGAPASACAAAQTSAPASVGAAVPAQVQEPPVRPAASAVPAQAPEPASIPARASAPAPSARAPKPAAPATVPASATPAMSSCAVTPASADDAELQRRWVETVKKIAAVQPSRGGLLQSSRAVSDDGETLVVAFPKGSNFALKMISRPDSNALVMPVICEVFGRRSVEYVMDGAPAAAPAAPAQPAVTAAPAPSRPVTPAPAAVPQAAPVSATSVAPDASMGAAAPTASRAATSAPAAPSPAPSQSQSAVSAPAPAPVAPVADHASGPTVLAERDIEADRKAWEDDMPPYDDAFIASYDDDAEVPPFDAPAPAPTAAPAPVPAPTGASRASVPAGAPASAPASAPTEAPAPAPDLGETADGDAPVDPKEVLQNIWGNVTFK